MTPDQALEQLRADPSREDALDLAQAALKGREKVPEVVIQLSAALLVTAQQRPPDEPPFARGPAHFAAGATQACFDSLSSAQRTDPRIGGYLQLNMADALRMMGPEYDEDALAAYKLALTIDDSNGHWWFNLGLCHKWRGRFDEALAANRKAQSLLGDQKPVLWNTAIAATALGEGKAAQQAWSALGMDVQLTDSGMPLLPGMPPAKIRVATVGDERGHTDPLPQQSVTFEVLWVQPLSPCHGVVQSPTVRQASVDYGDVVLWDGAPVRITEVDGEPVPVFPLLWILKPGDERRFAFVGMQKQPGMLERLAAELPDDCPLIPYDMRGPADGQQLFYGKAIIAGERDLAAYRVRLESAMASQPGLTLAMPALYESLEDTPAAGKSHQAWGGIERAAKSRGLLPS